MEVFAIASKTQLTCHNKAVELVGGNVDPVQIQGICSYSVYAGHEREFVVQFRPQSLPLSTESALLAQRVYGNLVPSVQCHGSLERDSENEEGKERLLVYVMDRLPGISYQQFLLVQGFPENENSSRMFEFRQNLLADIAR